MSPPFFFFFFTPSNSAHIFGVLSTSSLLIFGKIKCEDCSMEYWNEVLSCPLYILLAFICCKYLHRLRHHTTATSLEWNFPTFFFFFFYKKSVLFQMDFAVSSWTLSPLTRRWAMMSCSGTHELQYENIDVCKMEDMEMNYLIVWSKAGCLATRWYLHNKVAWYKLIMVVTVHQADSVFLH